MSELWQPWENLFLHEVGGTMPVSVIAEKLERTERAIVTQAYRIGAPLPSRMTGRRWTKAELFLLRRFTPEEVATATGRSIYSVRSKLHSLTRTSGGKVMPEWTAEELELLWRHSNSEVAEMTGRSIEEVGDKRLQTNIERNGWDINDPERAS
ncbi:hypothetical protein [Citrobacter koseri]|uniref:hypothetical protein n=1 Tax=Citrobacter koseri TaxID=545 RepID=UPI000DF0ED33|nr:hypothetical protein [Citrobacter koseri]STB29437.1 Uncharacterised protein [Citrobacter koseri]